MDYDATRYEVMNLGTQEPVSLTELVGALEQTLGLKATVKH
jgi:nucleoside-diphosphate-sugar epimerase